MGYPKWNPPQGTPMGDSDGEGKKGKPHGESSWDSFVIPMEMIMGHGESPWGQEFPVGILETRSGGRLELSHGRFLLDLGIFACVEHVLDTAENCSTHAPDPGCDLCIFVQVESQA